MPFVLDVAAGILIALAIVGIMFAGAYVATEDQRGGGDGIGGLVWVAFGIVLGIALVVCRLLRWP